MTIPQYLAAAALAVLIWFLFIWPALGKMSQRDQGDAGE